MTTLIEILPKWLRSRLKKSGSQRSHSVRKKERQILPDLPAAARPAKPSRNIRANGEWLLWRI
jgi:hypothetical protein